MSMKKLERMEKEDLKKLALDIHKGLVFTDTQLQQSNMLAMVFMPLAFIPINKKWVDQVGLIYEYLDKAGSRSINGMPTFMSMRIVPRADLPMLIEYVKKYEETEKAVENEMQKM